MFSADSIHDPVVYVVVAVVETVVVTVVELVIEVVVVSVYNTICCMLNTLHELPVIIGENIDTITHYLSFFISNSISA